MDDLLCARLVVVHRMPSIQLVRIPGFSSTLCGVICHARRRFCCLLPFPTLIEASYEQMLSHRAGVLFEECYKLCFNHK
jgi:hypothetical protein